jgi:predicted enzyme related to lactoylglutathione lyase
MLQHAPLVWAEIAVEDMDRALQFYQTHFEVSFKREFINDMDMAVLETADPCAASVGLVKHEMMKPSMTGSIIYLHLAQQLTPLVNKLTQANVTILLPVTPIKGGEVGYIAIFVDSEGNSVGLWANEL